MLFTYSNNVLKIDNNDHYFYGNVDKSSFPDIIKEEYEEIIIKSFTNISNNEMDISKIFIEPYNEYIIKFLYHSKPIFFETSIIIPLERHQKDFKDYMNERMVKLEEQILILSIKLESVSSNLINKKKEFAIEKENKEENNDSDEEDDSDEEEEEEEEKEIIIPPPKTIINKRAINKK
jgi:hypothetical protein